MREALRCLGLLLASCALVLLVPSLAWSADETTGPTPTETASPADPATTETPPPPSSSDPTPAEPTSTVTVTADPSPAASCTTDAPCSVVLADDPLFSDFALAVVTALGVCTFMVCLHVVGSWRH